MALVFSAVRVVAWVGLVLSLYSVAKPGRLDPRLTTTRSALFAVAFGVVAVIFTYMVDVAYVIE